MIVKILKFDRINFGVSYFVILDGFLEVLVLKHEL